jgi:hypothetical protein
VVLFSTETLYKENLILFKKYARDLVIGDRFTFNYLERKYRAVVVGLPEVDDEGQSVVECTIRGELGRQSFAKDAVVEIV